jgi:hypothetical protein
MTKDIVIAEETKKAPISLVGLLFLVLIVGLPVLVGLATGEKMIVHQEADPRMAWCLDDPDINRSAVGEGAASAYLCGTYARYPSLVGRPDRSEGQRSA